MLRCLVLFAAVLTAAPVLADRVILKSGDVLTGQVLEQSEQTVKFNHPDLGEFPIPAANVASVQLADADAEPVPAPVEQAPPPPPAEPEQKIEEAGRSLAAQMVPDDVADVLTEWNVSVEFGFTLSDGNTESTDLLFKASGKKENEHRRIELSTYYYYGTDDGDTTENEFSLSGLHDWLIPDEPWFFFVGGRYQYDEFQAWDHRLTGMGGIGYELINEEDLQVNLRAGAGGTYDIFPSGASMDDEFTPEALLSADLTWTITENQEFTAFVAYFPNLEELGEFRLNTGAEYKLSIPEWDGIAVKVGLLNEYDSDVAAGSEENDLKIYSTVVIDF